MRFVLVFTILFLPPPDRYMDLRGPFDGHERTQLSVSTLIKCRKIRCETCVAGFSGPTSLLILCCSCASGKCDIRRILRYDCRPQDGPRSSKSACRNSLDSLWSSFFWLWRCKRIAKYDGFMTSHQDYIKTLLVSMMVLACELVGACRGFVCVPIVS